MARCDSGNATPLPTLPGLAAGLALGGWAAHRTASLLTSVPHSCAFSRLRLGLGLGIGLGFGLGVGVGVGLGLEPRLLALQ